MKPKEFPKAPYGQRYIKVKAHLKTWTTVEKEIEFDTFTNQFIIPSGYQPDTKVIDWEYINLYIYEYKN